jgi:initiation factor 1A
MVKNTKGGSSHRKFASKNIISQKISNKLRISEHDGELYAIVTKMLGNGMFLCHCIDSVVRLGHIRGKFSGRGKRDNMVECGKWVLVGLREWDVQSSAIPKNDKKDKKQQCDLLEIYSDTDKYRLIEQVSNNWQILNDHDITKQCETKVESDIVFGTDRDFEREKLINEMKTSAMEKFTMTTSTEHEEEVHFDEI